MPAPGEHPDLYVGELPAGIRPIEGVPTSITAFVGRARRGPVDDPVTVRTYAEFERVFGGLWSGSALASAVYDYFAQGGGTAVVVRVHSKAARDVARLTLGGGQRRLRLVAASPGSWGAALSASIEGGAASEPTTFTLTVTDTGTGAVESHRDVSLDPASRRRVDEVLEQESSLVRVAGELPTRPQRAFPVTATAVGGNDGRPLGPTALTTGRTLRAQRRGLYALDQVDLVNVLVVPPDTDTGDLDARVVTDVIAYAAERRVVVLLDPPSTWSSVNAAVSSVGVGSLPSSPDAAVYFPRLRRPDPSQGGRLVTVAPSGAVAGVIARTDAAHGVWKAPAGLGATLAGVSELSLPLSDGDIDRLNPTGVNCLRVLPGMGPAVWGARTRAGSDASESDWTYLPVRRTALFIEESVRRGTDWVVFEPNDEPLWAQLRLAVGSFLHGLFRQGAFAGTTPREAYLVRCDRSTITQRDLDRGIVTIVVGFAPLKPAEFVLVTIRRPTAPQQHPEP
jgi:uncharacterized protein